MAKYTRLIPALDSLCSALDSYVRYRVRRSGLTTDDDRWITIHPNGKEATGRPVKINEKGEIVGGAVPRSAQGKHIGSWWRNEAKLHTHLREHGAAFKREAEERRETPRVGGHKEDLTIGTGYKQATVGGRRVTARGHFIAIMTEHAGPDTVSLEIAPGDTEKVRGIGGKPDPDERFSDSWVLPLDRLPALTKVLPNGSVSGKVVEAYEAAAERKGTAQPISAKPKATHEMTLSEYRESLKGKRIEKGANLFAQRLNREGTIQEGHRQAVENALQAGRAVPQSVLEDYPTWQREEWGRKYGREKIEGKPKEPSHYVQAQTPQSPEEMYRYARGVLATASLAQGNAATWAPKLGAKQRAEWEGIVTKGERQHPEWKQEYEARLQSGKSESKKETAPSVSEQRQEMLRRIASGQYSRAYIEERAKTSHDLGARAEVNRANAMAKIPLLGQHPDTTTTQRAAMQKKARLEAAQHERNRDYWNQLASEYDSLLKNGRFGASA